MMNWFKYAQSIVEDPPTEEIDLIDDSAEDIDFTPFQQDIDRLIQVPKFTGNPSDNALSSLVPIVKERFQKTKLDTREKAVFIDIDETLLSNKMSVNKILGAINVDVSRNSEEQILEILSSNGLEPYIAPNGEDIFVLRPHVREFLSSLISVFDHVFALTRKSQSYQSNLLGICGLDGFFERIFGSNKIDLDQEYNSILIDNSGIESKSIQGKLTSMGYSSSYLPIESGEFLPQSLIFTNMNGVVGDKERHLAAKNGDFDSALELVEEIVSDPSKSKIIEYIKNQFSNSILVPMSSIKSEEKDENILPLVLGLKLEEITGLENYIDIQKKAKTGHTNSDHVFRLLKEGAYCCTDSSGEEYEPDNSGKRFVIIDDIIGSGGSISSLKRYLEKTGGVVLGAICLAAGRKSGRIVPDKREYNTLVDKFGGYEELSQFLSDLNICDGIPENLTYAQVELLLSRASKKERDSLLARKKSIESYFEIIKIHRSLKEEQSQEGTNLLLKRIYDLAKNLTKEEYDKLYQNSILDSMYYDTGVQSPFLMAWHDEGNLSIDTMAKKDTPKIFFCEESDNQPSLQNSFSLFYKLKKSYILSDRPFSTLPGNELGEYIVRANKSKKIDPNAQQYEVFSEIEDFEKKNKYDMLICFINNQEYVFIKNINNLYKLPNQENEKMKEAFNLSRIKESAKPRETKKKEKAYNPNVAPKPFRQAPPIGGEPKTKKDKAKTHSVKTDTKKKYEKSKS